jgi:twitching motility protein PilT
MTPEQLLHTCIDQVIAQGASDLHLSNNAAPIVRVSGTMNPLLTIQKLSQEDIKGMLAVMLTPARMQKFLDTQEIDFSYAYGESARFRGNAFVERGHFAVALRLISREIRNLTCLQLSSKLLCANKASFWWWARLGRAKLPPLLL